MNITVNRGYIIQARPETPEFIRGATLYGTWVIHPNDSSITKVLHCAREAAMENGIKYNVGLDYVVMYIVPPPPPSVDYPAILLFALHLHAL